MEAFRVMLGLIALVLTHGTPMKDKNFQTAKVKSNMAAAPLKLKVQDQGFNWNDPVIYMTAIDMIQHQNYYAESHTVKTADGYLLELHRIPVGRFKLPDGKKRQPVLLMHGLEACSTNFVSNLWNQSLGYILADNGYDVWIGNARGNTYSKNHVTLSPKQREFWNFSWVDMAEYDLPAMVDYVLETTGYDQIFYVGHSQGTMMGFAKFSSDLEFAKKIKTFFALAPVAHVGHHGGLLKDLAKFTKEADTFFKIFGVNDLLDSNGKIQEIRKKNCKNNASKFEDAVCNNLMFALVEDKHSTETNISRCPVYLAHNPAGTSTKDIAHFGQMVNSNLFAKYDYGPLGNKKHYGTFKVPVFPVQNLATKTVLFSGGLDSAANPTDVAWLRSQLNPSILIGDFFVKNYVHTDFIWAMNAADVVYNQVLKIMAEQN